LRFLLADLYLLTHCSRLLHHYYAAVLTSRITGLFRPYVRPSACLSVCLSRAGF